MLVVNVLKKDADPLSDPQSFTLELIRDISSAVVAFKCEKGTCVCACVRVFQQRHKCKAVYCLSYCLNNSYSITILQKTQIL